LTEGIARQRNRQVPHGDNAFAEAAFKTVK
jgi:hypothetical protein